MDIEQLKSDPSVINLYRERLPELKQEGRNFVAKCPFHPDKTASFKIDSKNKYLFRCFGCSAAGSIVDFVMKFDGVDLRAALKVLQGAPQKEVMQTFKPFAPQKQAVTIPLANYEKYEKALAESKEAKEWLNARGISYETARLYHVGYRLDIGRLAGQDNSDISAAGWFIFPCVRAGRITGIKYRSIRKKVFTRQPGLATEVWGLENITPFEPVFVVEGEVDALSLAMLGLSAVSIPSASSTLSAEAKNELHTASEIILAGDSDSAGQAAMTKLWTELANHTYLLKWPSGIKDANQALVEYCKGSLSTFRTLVVDLTDKARSQPMPYITSVQESMRNSARVDMDSHPERLHFPWKSIDKMAHILPGDILVLYATQTGMGKTSFLASVLIDAAKKGETVLNYSAELSNDEYSNMLAARLLAKDRNSLTKDDYHKAADLMGNDAQFYVGNNPDLSTAGPVLDLIEKAIVVLNPSIIAIDHIHYICRFSDNEVKELADTMQRIKRLAVKYRVKFIVVAQPRKAKSDQKGRVVHITDVKSSETVTSDASVVLALHRDLVKNINPNNPPKEPYEPLVKIFLQKGRSQGGGNAYAELYFHGATASFSEVIPEPEEKDNFLFDKDPEVMV